MNRKGQPHVAIFQTRLTHYRVPLFERMRCLAGERGIRLSVVYGQPSSRESLRQDSGDLSWGERVCNRYWRVAGRELVWQPVPASVRDARLFVVTQENRLLSNYLHQLRRLGGRKMAFWGHGRNFQSNRPGGLRERWKAVFARQVDWWFAYTGLSVDIVRGYGFPTERITCLNNSIDLTGFRAELEAITPDELARARAEMGIAPRAPVLLMCGSLYPDKRPETVVAAADMARERFPDLALVVIGDGQSRNIMRAAAASRPWLYWVGSRHGRDKALYFRMATLLLSPGAIGLNILDGFAAGLPVVAMEHARHGPEIAYLQHGQNGLLTEAGSRAYGEAVVGALADPERLAAMVAGARAAAGQYSMEAMATRFIHGIEACLALP